MPPTYFPRKDQKTCIMDYVGNQQAALTEQDSSDELTDVMVMTGGRAVKSEETGAALSAIGMGLGALATGLVTVLTTIINGLYTIVLAIVELVITVVCCRFGKDSKPALAESGAMPDGSTMTGNGGVTAAGGMAPSYTGSRKQQPGAAYGGQQPGYTGQQMGYPGAGQQTGYAGQQMGSMGAGQQPGYAGEQMAYGRQRMAGGMIPTGGAPQMTGAYAQPANMAPGSGMGQVGAMPAQQPMVTTIRY
ncbi:hypothetical protein OE88DRAFT_1647500 [Heliocybe sulcata]|uniref:Uncharacterized protein n=1 Tax=Heliocybe sulcata TaxID=5364 RepID=A0A5C3MRN5_9AGAM|nr:hypothetical protein OE88DRAFT_1647500 [Heliocybe sulcata]